MSRPFLSVVLCAAAGGVGLSTVCLASKNRARGAELDDVQRWCEIFSRQNEALRLRIEDEEWRLLQGVEEAQAPSAPVFARSAVEVER